MIPRTVRRRTRRRPSSVASRGPVPGRTASPPSDLLLDRALLARSTFGARPAERSEVAARGRAAWLDEQLDPESIDDSALDARLAAYGWLGRSAAELRATYGSGGGWRLANESRGIRLLRAVHSRRQLLEQVVELWSDHFHVPFEIPDGNYLRPVYEAEVLRRHALGSFPALLLATATSPAMASYLDTDTNVAGDPNENYARELLELHTLGSDGGYTEQDVREVARCFTGWGWVRHWEPGTYGTFRFDPAAHDAGEKTVLGRRIAAGGGIEDAYSVLRLVALHPATARRVAAKVAHRLLGGGADAATVDRAARAFARTGGDVRAVLRVVLSDDALAAAAPWDRPRAKRPLRFLASLLRALDAPVAEPETGAPVLEGLGQVLHGHPTPDGYSDEDAAWTTNPLPRWRVASYVCNGWASWSGVSSSSLPALVGNAPRAEWPARVADRLGGGSFDEEDVAALAAHLAGAAPRPGDLAETFELAASSPSFQRY